MDKAKKQYDLSVRIALLGNYSTGKSSFLRRYITGFYNSQPQPRQSQLAIPNEIKRIIIDGKIVQLQIWDTTGQQKFNAVPKSYYQNMNVLFLFYDITNRKSFEDLKYWMGEVDKYAVENHVKVMIGTKSDLNNRGVGEEEAMSFARQNGLVLFEVSALNGETVNEVFEYTAKQQWEQLEECKKNTIKHVQQLFQKVIKPVIVLNHIQRQLKQQQARRKNSCC